MLPQCNGISRRKVLSSIGIGTIGITAGHVPATVGEELDGWTTHCIKHDIHNTSCSPWQYTGPHCPSQNSIDSKQAPTGNNLEDCVGEDQVEVFCCYEYSCDEVGAGSWRRECCYTPYQYENDTIIDEWPEKVGGPDIYQLTISSSLAREGAWCGHPHHDYWVTWFNTASSAETYNTDDEEFEEFLSECVLLVDNKGDGNIHTYIDDGLPAEKWVGASDDLDKSTTYDIVDYGWHIVDAAISYTRLGPLYDAGSVLYSMYDMATDEYDIPDKIELGYTFGDPFADKVVHWLKFNLEYMYAGNSTTIKAANEYNSGLHHRNEAEVSMYLNAPSYSPSEVANMDASEIRKQGINATTVENLPDEVKLAIQPHLKEFQFYDHRTDFDDIIVYLGQYDCH